MGEKIELPSKDELQQLQRWARVVLALRSAQRILPLFKEYWPGSPASSFKIFNNAQLIVADVASRPNRAYRKLLTKANADLLELALEAYRSDVQEIKNAGHCVACLRAATAVAINELQPEASKLSFSAIRASLSMCVSSLSSKDVSLLHLVKMEVWRDYEILRLLAVQHRWTDESPVDVALLGPLWPNGAPEGWPEEDTTAEPTAMKIEIAVPAGFSASESAEFNQRVAAFFAELSAMHVAMGGNGLRFLDAGSVETIPIEDDEPIDKEPAGMGGAR